MREIVIFILHTTVAYLGHIYFYYLSRAHDFYYFVDRFFFSIISCARLFLFRRSFFLFYYLVRTR